MGTCYKVVSCLNKLSMSLYFSSLLLLIMSVDCINAQILSTPPYFIKQPNREIFFHKYQSTEHNDEPFSIECEARGHPAPRYTWYKNGVLFHSDVYDKINWQQNNGTLVFVSPAKNDEGAYQCKATNVHGSAISNVAHVKQSELSYDDKNDLKVVFVNEGDPHSMHCDSPVAFPKPVIFWVLQSDHGALRTLNSPRITVDPLGDLHFSNVTFHDGNDESVYACTYNSDIRREYKLGSRVILNVAPSKSDFPVSRPPVVQFVSRQNIRTLRGKKLRLYCIYGGTPVPQVTWTKENGELLPDRHTFEDFGKTLVIDQVQLEDEGKYKCQVSNGNGPVTTRTMNVHVEAAPSWVKVPDSRNVTAEESAVFECIAQGLPKPILQWFVNGVPLDDVSRVPRRYVNDTTLILTNLMRSDTAVYQCNASNVHGYVHRNFYVNVMPDFPPTITQSPKRKTEAVIGSNILLSCKTNGAPVPKISWTKDGELVTGGRFKNEEGGLRIESVQNVDEGVYKCLARNKLGIDEATGSLVVKSRTVLVTKPEDFKVAAGDSATFTCKAIADVSLPLEILWLRNGQPIDFESFPRLIKANDSSLRISKIVQLDSGTYTCQAKTPLDSEEASALLTVQDVPNQPVILEVTCGEVMAFIKWRPNGDNLAAITNFIVQYSTSYSPYTWVDAFSAIPPSSTEFKISMTPYANYTFRVIAKNKIGQSPPSKKSGFCATPSDLPYKNPDNVDGYGTTSTNLVIKWDVMPKIQHNGPGLRYKVSWRRLDIPNAPISTSVVYWTASNITIENQPTFKPYGIKVEAFNNHGMTPFTANEVIVYSGEDVPLEAPKNFILLRTVDARSIIFKWDPVPPKSIRGHFCGYKIQAWTEKFGEKNIREMTVQPNLTEALVSTLVPDAMYSAQILAYNGAYNGPPSNLLTFRTPEGAPGPVPELVAFPIVGGTSLQLRWKKPEKPNGQLTGYRITREIVSGASLNDLKELPPIRISEETEARLSGLEPDTKYRFTIQATTRAGAGDPYFIEVTTRANVTGPPNAPDFRFTLLQQDERTVLRIEVMPRMSGNPGSNFKAQYRLEGESHWSESNLPPDQYWTELQGLGTSKKYDVRVVAVNESGSTLSVIKTIEV